jgi:hypothetical protein
MVVVPRQGSQALVLQLDGGFLLAFVLLLPTVLYMLILTFRQPAHSKRSRPSRKVASFMDSDDGNANDLQEGVSGY